MILLKEITIHYRTSDQIKLHQPDAKNTWYI